MNLFFRLLLVFVAAQFRARVGATDTSRLRMRVLPNDLDLNLHLSNARYLSFMDLGRIDLIVRSGLPKVLFRRRWRPLIGGTLIRYRFSLGLFEKFDIVTRVLWWDDKWFYFEQRMESLRGVAAVALSKGLVGHGSGVVPPDAVLRAVGLNEAAPLRPDAIARWLAAEEALRIEGRTSS